MMDIQRIIGTDEIIRDPNVKQRCLGLFDQLSATGAVVES